MLESLRSFVSGWVAKVLLVLLIGSFALWGVSGSILGGANSTNVANVGETPVTVRTFLSTYNRNLSDIQRRIGRRLTRDEARLFGVESRTLSNVVSFATLDEFAREQGLALSDETLARLLAENRQFQDSTGKFNRDLFIRAVRENQMRESDYITLQNASAVRGQITQSFATGNILPEVFTNAIGAYTNEERKFSHITITAEMAGSPPAPTDAEIKTYFEENVKKYAAPEYRKLEILSLEPKDIADEKSVSDEEIAKDYEARKTAYETPEKRRVQQIVFKSQEKADAAVKSLSEGALFETVLAENDVKLSDADLGLVSKSQLPAAIRDQAFALELNSTSEIIKGPFGPTMLRVSEITAATVTPLDEVKDQIRKDLALNRATEEISTMLETIEDSRAGGTSLAETAKNLKLKSVRLVEAIDRTGKTPDDKIINDLPVSSELLSQAFKTEVGAQGSPLDIGSTGYVWVDVLEITPARDRKLEEVADKVKTDYIAAEQAKLIAKKADDLKARMEKGATLATIATELGTEVKNTGWLKRNAEEVGFARSATAAGFSGSDKNIAVIDGAKAGEKQILTVLERKGVGVEAIKVPDDQIKLANEGAADDILSQMISNLQSSYTVTQNPTLINQALTQGY